MYLSIAFSAVGFRRISRKWSHLRTWGKCLSCLLASSKSLSLFITAPDQIQIFQTIFFYSVRAVRSVRSRSSTSSDEL